MTPPTYSPWWRPLEWLGRFGFFPSRPAGSPGLVGNPTLDHDCAQGRLWRDYCKPRALFDAWSPPQESPWSAFSKPTLFAALRDGGSGFASPLKPQHLPDFGDLGRPPPLDETAVILDLPGPQSVAYGAWLAQRRGFQPVALFNNWPHPMGLVNCGETLGALLYYVPWALEDKASRARGPPVFMLDRGRLGRRLPQVRDFDNRYYHNDADFPSGAILKQHGIRRLLYVTPPGQAVAGPAQAEGWRLLPGPDEMDDLNAYLHEARKLVGLDLAVASDERWDLSPPMEFIPAVRKTPFSTTKDPAFQGFRRSGAGGFGKLIPEPKSSGGGFG